jgi:hypothetical protein
MYQTMPHDLHLGKTGHTKTTIHTSKQDLYYTDQKEKNIEMTVPATFVTEKLVFCIQGLSRAEVLEAAGY